MLFSVCEVPVQSVLSTVYIEAIADFVDLLVFHCSLVSLLNMGSSLMCTFFRCYSEMAGVVCN